MKKLIVLIVLVSILTACAGKPTEPVASISPSPYTSYIFEPASKIARTAKSAGNQLVAEDEPTQGDIDKYKKIMDVLNAGWDVPEDNILIPIAEDMGMTIDEIKEWMNWVMPYATGVKMPSWAS